MVDSRLPWLLMWYRICLPCRKPTFNPWVGKIPRRRKWQPPPVFLPGEFHGQRVHGVAKTQTQLRGWHITLMVDFIFRARHDLRLQGVCNWGEEGKISICMMTSKTRNISLEWGAITWEGYLWDWPEACRLKEWPTTSEPKPRVPDKQKTGTVRARIKRHLSSGTEVSNPNSRPSCCSIPSQLYWNIIDVQYYVSLRYTKG